MRAWRRRRPRRASPPRRWSTTRSGVSSTGSSMRRSRPDVEPHRDRAGDLDAGAADLAVAHGGVQVAGGEQRALMGDGQVQHGARADEPRVHVAAVRTRASAVGTGAPAGATPITPIMGRSGTATPSAILAVPSAIGTMRCTCSRELVAEHAEPGRHGHHALSADVDGLDEDAQHVAGLRRPRRTRARSQGSPGPSRRRPGRRPAPAPGRRSSRPSPGGRACRREPRAPARRHR